MPNLKVFGQDDFYINKYKAPFAFYANYDIENYDIEKIESYEFSSLMFKEAGLEYGPMERFNTYMKDEEDFSKMQDLIEYDVLFGKSYYIDEVEKPEKNTMKMGLDEIEIKNIDIKDNKITLNGQNFTINSKVYLNGNAVKTKFIDPNTLEVDYVDNLDTLVVKQMGRNSTELSSSNQLKYSQTK